MNNRVFITGMGMISPLGNSVEENWKCMLESKSKFTAYEIQRSKKEEAYYVGRVNIGDEKNRYSYMAETVLQQAIHDSETFPQDESDRNGLIIGSSIGNIEYLSQVIKNHCRSLNLNELYPEVLAYRLAKKYSINSIVSVVNSACSSSTHAIGKAYRLIKNGIIDSACIIGIDVVPSDLGVTSFAALGVLSAEEKMRPFDVRHNGFILSEGAGAIILQSDKVVKSLNKKNYGEIIGFGASCDAYHIVAPDPVGEGAKLAMKRALEDADINPVKIDYINCHGTGTKSNDDSEYSAMESVFSDTVNAGSTKALTGHLLGACGIVETIFSSLSLKNNIMLGTANLSIPIKNGMIKINEKNEKRSMNVIMNNTFAFGGQNASLIIRK